MPPARQHSDQAVAWADLVGTAVTRARFRQAHSDEAIGLRLGQHPLNQGAARRLMLGMLGKRGAGVTQARHQLVTEQLKLAEAEDPWSTSGV